MSRIAILEVYSNEKFDIKKAIDAHLRNSIRIRDILGCDLLVTTSDYVNALDKNYDCLILGYATRYAPFQLIKKLIEKNPNAKKIVISNEYNICPTVGGFNPFYLISNYENIPFSKKSIQKHFYINLNILIFNYNKSKEITCPKKYECIYYGTFRKNRKKYFKEYLQKGIYLSTSTKNMKQFKHIGCNPNYLDKFSWIKNKETLRNFKYALYIEDDYSHLNYNSLANRFYESVMCQTVVFFDTNCRSTIEISGLALDEFFFVKGYDDLIEKIQQSNYLDLYEKQKHFIDFCIDEKNSDEQKLIETINKIIQL